MREVTVFIGTNKDGVDHIENLKNQVLELFAIAKEEKKDDIYYKYNTETGEFLRYSFSKFELFPTQSNTLQIKGPILFVEKIHNDNKSVDSFLEDNKRRYLLEYLEQLQSSKNIEFINEAKIKTQAILKNYKNILADLQEEVAKFESFIEDKNFFEDKKETLMYEVKKLNFDTLMDKFMLFFKGIRGGKSKKNYEALIDQKDEACDQKNEKNLDNLEKYDTQKNDITSDKKVLCDTDTKLCSVKEIKEPTLDTKEESKA
ncbi:hypothetical protein [Campylobacter corcagiensis]|uniref:Uncharacterized protein n=1 Tax=Campylobacter corcagiensis TaxID=1448857 RepID=A0A7M1LHH2_9BACT|nr:hypothetical protein [Campylobacter corcagiensis]QKF64527.1 hypothetical protein CCORG_0661 [Campylobacter corcagiensis]QOQ87296.1 hypothetical protein IMC76_00255 [Campylobacter corcagiensis]